MKSAEFATWMKAKGIPHKHASDIASRCRRLERTLEILLDDSVKKKTTTAELRAALNKIAEVPFTAVNAMMHAYLRYQEFKTAGEK